MTEKQIDYRNPNHKSNRAYDLHRFPEMELSDVRDHVMRYKEILNRFADIDASAIGPSKRIFKIAPNK